jgi:hypothetical protein
MAMHPLRVQQWDVVGRRLDDAAINALDAIPGLAAADRFINRQLDRHEMWLDKGAPMGDGVSRDRAHAAEEGARILAAKAQGIEYVPWSGQEVDLYPPRKAGELWPSIVSLYQAVQELRRPLPLGGAAPAPTPQGGVGLPSVP